MTDDQYKLATAELNGRLFIPYQRDGVQWMLKQENRVNGPKGGFLCDEMGLGKTVQLITTMLGNPKQRTLLIVPKSIIAQWVQEIKRFAPSLTVQVFDGLVVHHAEQIGASAIIRGLRAMSDFEYEFEMALMNKHLAPSVEIVFFMTSQEYLYVSSSRLKELVRFGASVDEFVPPIVADALKRKLGRSD